jgi:cyclohexa-1,5-dienecarbonyl-CoA hydratase
VTSGPVTTTLEEGTARATITFFHPKGNVITAETIAALGTALETIAANPAVKLINLQGAGADFSFGSSVPEHAPDRIGNVLPAMHRLIEAWLQAPAVTAAVVRGRCLGGGFELALACDLIFAADTATFGLPEIALGVFPPAAAALLPLRTGAAVATRSIVTGEFRSAAEWQRDGLVTLVAPEASLDVEIDRWFAAHLATRSAAALRYAAAAARLPLLAQIRRTLPELERLYLDGLMRTHDAAEGVAAFQQKRKPRWTDR